MWFSVLFQFLIIWIELYCVKKVFYGHRTYTIILKWLLYFNKDIDIYLSIISLRKQIIYETNQNLIC